jgi:hypothetical protein
VGVCSSSACLTERKAYVQGDLVRRGRGGTMPVRTVESDDWTGHHNTVNRQSAKSEVEHTQTWQELQ